MYLPLHEDEHLEVQCPEGVTIIAKPFTGKNALFVDNLMLKIDVNNVKPEEMAETTDKVFNYFVCGFKCENHPEKMFTSEEKASSYFGPTVKIWFTNNVRELNRLTVEEKKI